MRILRKVFLFVLFFLLLIFAGMFWFLNSDYLYSRLVPRVVQAYLPDGKITSLKCKTHTFRWPCRFLLKDVNGVIQKKDMTEEFSAETLYMEYALFKPNRDIRVFIKNLQGKFPPCTVKNFSLNTWLMFDSKGGIDIEGNLEIEAADFYNLSITRILSSFKGHDGKIDFFNVFAKGYDGKIWGEIFLDYLSGMSYSINLKLTDLSLKKMRSAYPDIFSQVDGRLSGKVEAKGRKDKIGFLKADLDIPSGGKLKASLLGFITGYLPQSIQKKELESLIAANGEVPFENGVLSLQSVSDEKLATTVALKSQKFNLDMNVGVDINLDDGFQNLFHYLEKTFKQ